MRTLKYIFATAVILGFLGYVCYDIFFPNGLKHEDTVQAKEKNTALIIGAVNNISSLPIWIAEEDSIFEHLNIDIRVKDFTDQLDCDMAFANGRINMEITDPVRAEWLKSEKKQTFTELQTPPMPYAMVACHNSRIAKLSQLKDKLIAVTRNSSYSETANHCLDSIHLSRDSVYQFQLNNPAVAVLMLHNSELDATFLPEPYISLAKAMGHNILYKNHKQAQLIAKSDASKEEIKRFNKAYAEAVSRIRSNGLGHYANLIARRCKCSSQFEKELKVVF